MHIEAVLHSLGYPLSQVKIYLSALQMGECTIASLTEQVGMPRTTVAELVADMHKHGLMNYYVRKGRKYWVAENPDKLLVTQKERQAGLEAILPQLHSLKFNSGEARPHIRTYVGLEEVKNIYDDIILTKHHILAVVSWDDVQEFFGSEFIADFVERRYSHFLKMRLIAPRTKLSLSLKAKDGKELRQTRFLPDHITLGRVSSFIYDGKTAIISMNRRVPTGVIIHDPDIARSQTIYFESLWQHSLDQ